MFRMMKVSPCVCYLYSDLLALAMRRSLQANLLSLTNPRQSLFNDASFFLFLKEICCALWAVTFNACGEKGPITYQMPQAL